MSRVTQAEASRTYRDLKDAEERGAPHHEVQKLATRFLEAIAAEEWEQALHAYAPANRPELQARS